MHCIVLCARFEPFRFIIPSMNLENTKAQMRKGTLEFCILLIISSKPVYASDILAALKKADLIVVEGTLYPLLTRLKNAKWLTYQWRESKNGPPRKYYSLTLQGRKALLELRSSWEKFSDSIHSLMASYG